MKREIILAGVLACALGLPLAGCSDSPSSTAVDDSSTQGQTEDFDAVSAYWGQWRGSVETSGTSVYGTTGGTEGMLDINLGQDGTCSVDPLETHADLLSDTGTWEGSESEITLHLDSAGDITLRVVDSVTLEADASAFEISDFDTITFSFYG